MLEGRGRPGASVKHRREPREAKMQLEEFRCSGQAPAPRMPMHKCRLGGRKRPWRPAWDGRESGTGWPREKPGGRESGVGGPRELLKELEVAVGAESAGDFIGKERGREAEEVLPRGSKVAERATRMPGVLHREETEGVRPAGGGRCSRRGFSARSKHLHGGRRHADLDVGLRSPILRSKATEEPTWTPDFGRRLELGSRGRWLTVKAGLDAGGLLTRRPWEAGGKRLAWRSGGRLGR